METVKVDDKQRVRLPDVKPGQVFALQNNGDDSITLIKVKAERKEPFPRGSLAKYAGEWNREFGSIARKMTVPAPEDLD